MGRVRLGDRDEADGGEPFMSRGWESHVYQRVNGRWALVQLHYSAPVQPQ